MLSQKDKHFFKCLSWLIATKKLEIKASVPKKNKVGIVHQKFGLFKDISNETVAFTGSVNFSANALFNNVEAISCDFSWQNNDIGTGRIKYFEHLFHKTWTGFSDVVEIIPIEKVKTVIQESFPVEHVKELVDEELELVRDEINSYDLPKSYLKRWSSFLYAYSR